ncbi:5-amino-6-(5-phospho-D-ribitylamino)uracil phosphatase YigB [Salinarchaeum chitinilyticum]
MPLDVDAVCFDLDDTLCAYEETVEEVLARSFERADVEPFFDGVRYRSYFDRFLDDFEDVDELREHCFTEIARDVGKDPLLGRDVASAYASIRDPSNVRPLEGAIETVRAVGAAYPIALITNGEAAYQSEKIEGIGLVDAFDVTVFAGDEVAPKPETAPFERVLEELDVAPDRMVHVGNSLSSDVAGARASGLQTVWTPAAHDLPEDVTDPERVTVGHPAVDPSPDHVLSRIGALQELL